MFRFSFADPAAPAQHAAAAEQEAGIIAAAEEPAVEVPVDEGVPTGSQETVAVSPSLSLIKGVVSNAQAASLLADERVASNDLIAGVYEGGFKTWEGGVDLAQYLATVVLDGSGQHAQQQGQPPTTEMQQPQQPQQPQQQQPHGRGDAAAPALALGPGSRVMELGCGSGLPGLVALWAGAEVHFQDYNRSVLTTLTIQNVTANTGAWALRGSAVGAASRARFFAGSWDALPALLAQQGLAQNYDLVLTAETIYSLEAMRSLYAAVKACLRPGSGAALVAAKSYYFGVGGGTAAFARLVAADGCYDCSTVAVLDDGLSNKREILALTPRRDGAAPAGGVAGDGAEER